MQKLSPPQSQLNNLIEYCKNGNNKEAEKLASQIIDKFPNHQFSWKVLGAVYGQTDRMSKSLNANQKAVVLSPKDPEAHYNLGITLQSLGRLDDAEKSYLQAISLKDNYSKAYFNIGILMQNRESDLVKSYKEKNNIKRESKNEIIERYLPADKYLEKALESYTKAINSNPEYLEAYLNLGEVLQKLGKFKDSEVSYKRLISLKPEYAEAHNNLGIALDKQGLSKEAEKSYRKAIAIKYDLPQAHYNLGNLLQNLNINEKAELSFREAIKLNPDYIDAYLNLGVVLEELDRPSEAIECFNRAKIIQPESIDVTMNRWRLLFNQKEYEKALEESDSCNTIISKQNSLVTLYALGRIEEIYKRIEEESKMNNENLLTASFSSFLSRVEKRDTANNFCNKPMNFLYHSNISSHLKNSKPFLKGIINELQEVEAVWEPYKKTTRKGFQTRDNLNLFSNSSVKIEKLKSIIFSEIDLYYNKFKNESCSFIQKWPSKNNLFGWHVILKNQGYQDFHIHPGGWLSGVIYLKVVPHLKKNEGAIEFSMNGVNYHDINAENLIYQPKEGDIVLFPSSLHHKTIPFTTKTDRIIVSFDLMPEELNINL